jgi:hypothetical protein
VIFDKFQIYLKSGEDLWGKKREKIKNKKENRKKDEQKENSTFSDFLSKHYFECMMHKKVSFKLYCMVFNFFKILKKL